MPSLSPSTPAGRAEPGQETSSARAATAEQATTPHLFVPGPTYVRPEILAAMAQPMVGHRGPEFSALHRSVTCKLAEYAGTAATPLVATGSATALLESAIRSLVPDRSLHAVCGAFSARWEEIARLNGRSTAVLEVPPGRTVRAEAVAEALAAVGFDAVCVTHSETATGALHDLTSIAEALREFPDVLFLVDAVSSFAATPIDIDALGIDLLVTGTQKALALPPGLAIAFASDRALARARRARHAGYYLDLARLAEYAARSNTPTTPGIPLFFAFDRQLDDLIAETAPVRFNRHRRMAALAEAFCDSAGFEILPEAGYRSPALTVALTGDLDAEALRAAARSRGWIIGSGYGELKGRCFRIGHMGDHDEAEVAELVAVLGDIVEEMRRS